jgi:hypothetical protein
MPAFVEAVDATFIVEALSGRAPNLPGLAKQLAGDPKLLSAVIDALGSLSPRIRFAAAKLLRLVGERSPAVLYPHFECFVRLLRDKNSILRWNAMLTLGHLAAADNGKKLDAILDTYLAPISGKSLIDAANTIRGAATIARAKPYLADEIARAILKVGQARYATRECRNVAIGHAIIALGEFFSSLYSQDTVLSFVRHQKKNPRRATRDQARKFLAKWPATLCEKEACQVCDC